MKIKHIMGLFLATALTACGGNSDYTKEFKNEFRGKKPKKTETVEVVKDISKEHKSFCTPEVEKYNKDFLREVYIRLNKDDVELSDKEKNELKVIADSLRNQGINNTLIFDSRGGYYSSNDYIVVETDAFCKKHGQKVETAAEYKIGTEVKIKIGL